MMMVSSTHLKPMDFINRHEASKLYCENTQKGFLLNNSCFYCCCEDKILFQASFFPSASLSALELCCETN